MGVCTFFFWAWETISGTRTPLRRHWRPKLLFGGHNWRSTGGQSLKSAVLDSWVSFHRFLALGNPNLAPKHCSDVTGGHNRHLERPQLEANWRPICKLYCIGPM